MQRTLPLGGTRPSSSGVFDVAITWAWASVAYVLALRLDRLEPSAANDATRIASDTLVACLAALAAVVLLERWARAGAPRDGLVAAALLVLVAAGLAPESLTLAPAGFEVAVPASLRISAAALMVVAATRGVTARRPSRAAMAAATGIAILIVCLLPFATYVFAPHDAVGLASSEAAAAVSDEVLAVLHLLAAAGFVAASLLFARPGTDDLIGRAAGPACVLLALSRMHHALVSSDPTVWSPVGDVFRSGGYVLLLAASVAELVRHQRTQKAEARSEALHQLIGDLHDGPLQELAFIRLQVASGQELSASDLEEISVAAERAATEIREAVTTHALRTDRTTTAEHALETMLSPVATRAGVEVSIDLDHRVRLDPSSQAEVVMIAREATNNACRHGEASRVTINLSRVGLAGSRLRVRDDGSGFDPTAVGTAHGFGLTSIRQRALRLGGELRVESSPGKGCLVEVTW